MALTVDKHFRQPEALTGDGVKRRETVGVLAGRQTGLQRRSATGAFNRPRGQVFDCEAMTGVKEEHPVSSRNCSSSGIARSAEGCLANEADTIVAAMSWFFDCFHVLTKLQPQHF